MIPSTSSMTPKQLKKFRNKLAGSEAVLTRFQQKLNNVQQNGTPSGLSKGQRRRRNKQKLKASALALPRGIRPPGVSSFPSRVPRASDAFGTDFRTTTLRNDEFIADVVASETFASTRYAMNPGQSPTFPWLSTIAKNFEKWRFTLLEFYYKHSASVFAQAGQQGKVILSFDYDASDLPPATRQQAEDRFPHVDCMPSEDVCLTISPYQLTWQDSKYIRPGMLPANADIKTYDGGNLSVATDAFSSGSGGSICGELHVRYVVELSVPILEAVVGKPANYHLSEFVIDSSNPQTFVGGVATEIDWTHLASAANPLQVVVSGTVMTLPPGNYLAIFGLQVLGAGAIINHLTNWEGTSVFSASIQPYMSNAVTTDLGYYWQTSAKFLSSDGTGTLTLKGTTLLGAGNGTYTCTLSLLSV